MDQPVSKKSVVVEFRVHCIAFYTEYEIDFLPCVNDTLDKFTAGVNNIYTQTINVNLGKSSNHLCH